VISESFTPLEAQSPQGTEGALTGVTDEARIIQFRAVVQPERTSRVVFDDFDYWIVAEGCVAEGRLV
jgi:hypothetical protein